MTHHRPPCRIPPTIDTEPPPPGSDELAEHDDYWSIVRAITTRELIAAGEYDRPEVLLMTADLLYDAAIRNAA